MPNPFDQSKHEDEARDRATAVKGVACSDCTHYKRNPSGDRDHASFHLCGASPLFYALTGQVYGYRTVFEVNAGACPKFEAKQGE